MSAAATPGLGDLQSTKPMSRAERRAQAARVHAEPKPQQAEPAGLGSTDTEPRSAAASAVPTAPAPAPAVVLPIKTKKTKRPFSTQLRAETIARLDWAQRHGAALTDTVDAAVNAYLNAAGVPHPGANGDMPD